MVFHIFLFLYHKAFFAMFFIVFSLAFLFLTLSPIFTLDNIIISYGFHPFDICQEAPIAWKYIKIVYIISYIWSSLIIANSIYSIFAEKLFKKTTSPSLKNTSPSIPNNLHLNVGKAFDTNSNIYIPENGLYQNILITGTIGTGKTSSAMYPFTKQLISYSRDRLGMLILDVKR